MQKVVFKPSTTCMRAHWIITRYPSVLLWREPYEVVFCSLREMYNVALGAEEIKYLAYLFMIKMPPPPPCPPLKK